MTRTEFILEFDRLSGDVDRGPKSISQCRDVEHVTLETQNHVPMQRVRATDPRDVTWSAFTGWEGAQS